jgi:hypothetical protein
MLVLGGGGGRGCQVHKYLQNIPVYTLKINELQGPLVTKISRYGPSQQPHLKLHKVI